MKLDREETAEAIKQLALAREAGRPIVPLVGGGLSAESGVPTLNELTRYFAYLRAFVHHRAYLPAEYRKGRHQDGPLYELIKRHDRSLKAYINHVGWPGTNDLIAGLWELAKGDEKDRMPE